MNKSDKMVLLTGAVLGIVGYVFFTLLAPSLSVVLTASDLSIRPMGIFGTPSVGTIEFNDAGPNGSVLPEQLSVSPYRVDLKWTGLNLDGRGGEDDTVFFTLVATGYRAGYSAPAPVQMNNEGWGVANLWLAERQSMHFYIEDVRLGEGTKGEIVFDGFTGGAVMKTSMKDASEMVAEINGQKRTIKGNARRYEQWNAEFDPVKKLAFRGGSRDGGILVSVRAFNLQFTYEK